MLLWSFFVALVVYAFRMKKLYRELVKRRSEAENSKMAPAIYLLPKTKKAGAHSPQNAPEAVPGVPVPDPGDQDSPEGSSLQGLDLVRLRTAKKASLPRSAAAARSKSRLSAPQPYGSEIDEQKKPAAAAALSSSFNRSKKSLLLDACKQSARYKTSPDSSAGAGDEDSSLLLEKQIKKKRDSNFMRSSKLVTAAKNTGGTAVHGSRSRSSAADKHVTIVDEQHTRVVLAGERSRTSPPKAYSSRILAGSSKRSSRDHQSMVRKLPSAAGDAGPVIAAAPADSGQTAPATASGHRQLSSLASRLKLLRKSYASSSKKAEHGSLKNKRSVGTRGKSVTCVMGARTPVVPTTPRSSPAKSFERLPAGPESAGSVRIRARTSSTRSSPKPTEYVTSGLSTSRRFSSQTPPGFLLSPPTNPSPISIRSSSATLPPQSSLTMSNRIRDHSSNLLHVSLRDVRGLQAMSRVMEQEMAMRQQQTTGTRARSLSPSLTTTSSDDQAQQTGSFQLSRVDVESAAGDGPLSSVAARMSRTDNTLQGTDDGSSSLVDRLNDETAKYMRFLEKAEARFIKAKDKITKRLREMRKELEEERSRSRNPRVITVRGPSSSHSSSHDVGMRNFSEGELDKGCQTCTGLNGGREQACSETQTDGARDAVSEREYEALKEMNKNHVKHLEDVRRQHEEDQMKWKRENDQLHETLASLTSDCEEKQVEIRRLRAALADSQAGEDELRASLSSEAEQAHQSMGMKEIDAQKLSFEVLSKDYLDTIGKLRRELDQKNLEHLKLKTFADSVEQDNEKLMAEMDQLRQLFIQSQAHREEVTVVQKIEMDGKVDVGAQADVEDPLMEDLVISKEETLGVACSKKKQDGDSGAEKTQDVSFSRELSPVAFVGETDNAARLQQGISGDQLLAMTTAAAEVLAALSALCMGASGIATSRVFADTADSNAPDSPSEPLLALFNELRAKLAMICLQRETERAYFNEQVELLSQEHAQIICNLEEQNSANLERIFVQALRARRDCEEFRGLVSARLAELVKELSSYVPAEVVEGQAYSTGGVDYQALFYLIKQRLEHFMGAAAAEYDARQVAKFQLTSAGQPCWAECCVPARPEEELNQPHWHPIAQISVPANYQSSSSATCHKRSPFAGSNTCPGDWQQSRPTNISDTLIRHAKTLALTCPSNNSNSVKKSQQHGNPGLSALEWIVANHDAALDNIRRHVVQIRQVQLALHSAMSSAVSQLQQDDGVKGQHSKVTSHVESSTRNTNKTTRTSRHHAVECDDDEDATTSMSGLDQNTNSNSAGSNTQTSKEFFKLRETLRKRTEERAALNREIQSLRDSKKAALLKVDRLMQEKQQMGERLSYLQVMFDQFSMNMASSSQPMASHVAGAPPFMNMATDVTLTDPQQMSPAGMEYYTQHMDSRGEQ